MSDKNRDKKNRWRNKTVAFRMSPEEAYQLDLPANTSGLNKQDYLINRVLCKDITVNPNIRVQKYLEQYLVDIADELRRIEKVDQQSDVIGNLECLLMIIKKCKKGLRRSKRSPCFSEKCCQSAVK